MTAKIPRAPQQRGPRLFVEGLSSSVQGHLPHTLSLPKSDSHYVGNVLRLRAGDPLEIADRASGEVFEARVAALHDLVTIEIKKVIGASVSGQRAVTLLFALCKGSKNDLVCDWATELGCAHIIFWQAARSVVRLRDESDALSKAERLSKIGRAAAQQSRQSRPPAVSVVRSLSDAVAAVSPSEGSLNLVCSLSEKAHPIGDLLRSSDSPLVLVIGPEGDISPEEEQVLATAGFEFASLGPYVLRSELAAVAALMAARP